MLTLVLLPGMDGTGHLFEPFIRALQGQFDVRVVHYPVDAGLGYEPLEAIARRALPEQGEFVILGESFSGPIAISLAASRPAGLVGLVLCCTFARNPHPAFAALRSIVRFLPVKHAPSALLSRWLLGRFTSADRRSSLNAALARVSADAFRARVRAVLAVDVSDRLRAIDVPLLYLRASEDRVVPESAATHIAQVLPAAQVQCIDAPHFLLQVAPDAAARAIAAFTRPLRVQVENGDRPSQ